MPVVASGSQANTNPRLGLLGIYGSAMPTVPLFAGSPAIDAGNPAWCQATDQRELSGRREPAATSARSKAASAISRS